MLTTSEKPPSQAESIRHIRLSTLLYLSLALLPWGIVLLSSARGFDLTDEGFYLLSLAHPEDLTSGFSLFGALLNPLYTLVCGQAAALRALGTLILLGLAACTSWISLSHLRSADTSATADTFERDQRRLLMLLLSAGSVLYYFPWLLTPSYNWLTLVGITVFWCGFVLWSKARQPRIAALGIGLFAFAATVVLWAKLTSSVFLILYPTIALLTQRPLRHRLLNRPSIILSGVAGLALGLSLPLWHGLSPQGLVELFQRGIEHQQILKPSIYHNASDLFINSVQQFWTFFFANSYPAAFIPVWLTPLISVFLLARWLKPTRREWVARLLALSYVVNLVVLTLALFDTLGYWALNVFLLTGVYVGTGNLVQRRLTPRAAPKRQYWIIPALGLAFIYIFGTDQNYAYQSGLASYFYLLAAALLLVNARANSIQAGLIRWGVPTLLLCITALTYFASLTPYRQPVSVWSMDTPVTLVNESQTLTVSSETGRYLNEFLSSAASSGFAPGTPLIDLTGEAPGLVYALGGRAYGFPWLITDYVGSTQAALFILRQWQPSDLERAWLLTSDTTRADLLAELPEVGLLFPNAYQPVGSVRAPEGSAVHTLWQPTRR